MTRTVPLDTLRTAFGDRLQEKVSLAHYTTARTGGPADALLPVHTLDELVKAAQTLWELDTPFIVLGSGSNLLVSDAGVRAVVLLNQARNTRINARNTPPNVYAESGCNLGGLARQAALRGLSGLEWAATIPGTVGGAVYGNAGAHGADMKNNLILAEILHRNRGKETWTCDRMGYQYRSSVLKREPGQAVILSATMQLMPSTPEEVKAKMEAYTGYRRRTQPPGATMGSMFKNPDGDYAGRLIEAAGLKGERIGEAEISTVHANFFINRGHATASDIWQLIRKAQMAVAEKFGIQLELEIELLGDFSADETVVNNTDHQAR